MNFRKARYWLQQVLVLLLFSSSYFLHVHSRSVSANGAQAEAEAGAGAGKAAQSNSDREFIELTLSSVASNESSETRKFCTAAGLPPSDTNKFGYITKVHVHVSSSAVDDVTLFGCRSLPSDIELLRPDTSEDSESISNASLEGAYWECNVKYYCASGLQVFYNWQPSASVSSSTSSLTSAIFSSSSFTLPAGVGWPIGPGRDVSYLVMKVTFAANANRQDFLGTQQMRVSFDSSESQLSSSAASYMLLQAKPSDLDLKSGTDSQFTCRFDSMVKVKSFSPKSDSDSDDSDNESESETEVETSRRFLLAYIEEGGDVEQFMKHESQSEEKMQTHQNWKVMLRWYLVNHVDDPRLPKVMIGLDSRRNSLSIGDYMLLQCSVTADDGVTGNDDGDRDSDGDGDGDQSEKMKYFIFPSTVDVCCFIQSHNMTVRLDDETLAKMCPGNQSQEQSEDGNQGQEANHERGQTHVHGQNHTHANNLDDQEIRETETTSTTVATSSVQTSTSTNTTSTNTSYSNSTTSSSSTFASTTKASSKETKPLAKEKSAATATVDEAEQVGGEKDAKNSTGHCAMMDVFMRKFNGTLPKKFGPPKKSESESDTVLSTDSTEADDAEVKDSKDVEWSDQDANVDEESAIYVGSTTPSVSSGPIWKTAHRTIIQASDWLAERTGLSSASVALIPIACGLILFAFVVMCCVMVVCRRSLCCKRRSEWSVLRHGDRGFPLVTHNDDDEDDEDDEEHYSRSAATSGLSLVRLNGKKGATKYNARHLAVD